MEAVLERETELATTTGRAMSAPTPRSISFGLEEALTRFTKIVRGRLRFHDLRRHGIDEDDVEQDIRIRLWSALQRAPASELSGAYVQKVVLSAVIDAVRRERTRRYEIGQDVHAAEATQPDQGKTPELLFAQHQWMENLQQCIARLPLRRQRPVRLFLLGYSMQELSDISRLTLDAASKLVRRGLADLRTLLSRTRELP